MSVLKHQHQEEFEKTIIGSVSGRPLNAYLIRCGKCRETDKIRLPNGGPIPPDEAARRFQAKGWDTSKGRRDRDVCPRCTQIKPLREVKTMKSTNVVAMPVPIIADSPKADAPEAMTRDDKRVIFAKLNDVYVDERVGYGDGWTDARVASDLGIARAWVAVVREENFGPEAANEEIRGLLTQAKGLIDDVHKHGEALGNLRASLDAIEKRIKQLEMENGPLSMHANRIEKHLERIEKNLGIV
jgi:hypothetical protein